MASRLPVTRQIAWVSVLPQLGILLAMIILAKLLAVDNFVLVSAAAYVMLSISLRTLVPRHQRRGMRLFRQERFAEAIPRFESSYRYFGRHPWLDRCVTSCC